MTTRVYVPQDTTARALGADAVAERLPSASADIEIIRNSSRGAFWLEPLIEVESEAGRVAAVCAICSFRSATVGFVW